MRFERRFVVDAPLERVRAFHADPRALRRLTPAPVEAPEGMPPIAEGAAFRFRLWIPFPVEWRGRYLDVREDGFVDVMEEGPFAAWRHERRWRALESGRTEIMDAIEARHGSFASRVLWASLRPTFAYRAWRTRAATKAK